MASTWDLPLAGTPSPIGGDHDAVARERFLRVHAVPSTVVPVDGLHATLVVMHGGYWKNQYGLDDAYGNAGTGSLAPFFLQRGFGAVELEYRRRDHEGGGWPGTNQDVLCALQRLCELREMATSESPEVEHLDARCKAALCALRPDRLILVGHSAGGCLALWAAHALGAAASTSSPRVSVVLAAAPVADLVRAHEMRVSDEGDAVEKYMKLRPDGEADSAEAYQQASPMALLPVTFPTLVAYGDADVDVPPELCASYAQAAAESSPNLVRELRIASADHFDVVNAASNAWTAQIVPALADLLELHVDLAAATALRG